RQVTAAIAEAETQFEKAKAATQTNYEKRKIRIGKAFQSSKELALKRIDDKVGGSRYEMQRRTLQAEKDRGAALTAQAARIEEFRKKLAEEQERLAQLEVLAQQSFKGYAGFQSRFLKAYEQVEGELGPDENVLFGKLQEQVNKGRGELDSFRGYFLLRLFRLLPVWLILTACAFALPVLLPRFGISSFSYLQAGVAAASALSVVLGLRWLSMRQAAPAAERVSKTLASGRRLHDVCREKAEAHHQQELERIKNDYVQATTAAEQQFKRTQTEASEKRVSCRMDFDQRTVQITEKHEQHSRRRRERLEREHGEGIARLKLEGEERAKALAAAWEAKQQQLSANHTTQLRTLETEWKASLEPVYRSMDTARATAEGLFAPWSDARWTQWTPPERFSQAAQFGLIEVDVPSMCEAMPKEKALALPGPARFSLPVCMSYPEQGSILIETANTGHDQAIGTLNNIILRLLSTAPPGRLNFTIIDPVGLGQNFAGVMHLADYEEQLINNRIWTQSGQIEQKLADLNEHMEKVIQMYLRNEYQTIAEYNEQAGVIAEKYHFLVIADFPANFTETAIKRLLSIATSGARCGVYTLIHWDRRHPVPQDFIPDDLRKAGVTVSFQGKDLIIGSKPRPGIKLSLDEPPAPERATELIHQIGRLSRDSSRVEVPFEHVAPPDAQIWSEETTTELRVPIGRTGATKLQYLAIGKGTRQHGLVAGKTGSGKSTLFHVIITNLALWSSPEEVEFYLVDFKKGVEFKCYGSKRLPHARVVAIESDREFGLSVLQRVDDELRRRGDMFRQLGVQDVAGYKRAGGKEPLPRTLLLIDEFQEFFVEDDKISQTASLLLDRIVRQGRAFGIHVLLGSQTLGGAYTVARTTLGQMVIRVALQCNEADSYLIMDEGNPAPRLLSRPGEG
ncbi:MAG TPA: FtsK/SpoIIIE domain-containing protein, partial [Clostridia bacterium]|nr:FtsK/SpoIIIE domain-containing protein [Clostridia bacterium]